MNSAELDALLRQFLADGKLSGSERQALMAWGEKNLATEQDRSVARSRLFESARSTVDAKAGVVIDFLEAALKAIASPPGGSAGGSLATFSPGDACLGLIVNHFIIIAKIKMLNSYPGIILPMLISPVTVIVYKQFFDGLPREYREAALMDGATEFQLLFRVFIPMNWGVTAALAIITFIGAWNAFLWPFLAVSTEEMMTVTVGISQVQDAYGVAYARVLAGAVMAGLPVALAYLLFQRRVTQAITLSAGIKG